MHWAAGTILPTLQVAQSSQKQSINPNCGPRSSREAGAARGLHSIGVMSAEHVQNQHGPRIGTYLLLSVIAMAAGGWLWRSRTGAGAEATQSSQVHSTLHLDTFVLNLSDRDERAYLRVGVDLGLRSDPQTKNKDAPPLALIRDTILGVLGKARSEDVLSAEGKQKLKAELLRALRERSPALGVEEVYFTEFLIQR